MPPQLRSLISRDAPPQPPATHLTTVPTPSATGCRRTAPAVESPRAGCQVLRAFAVLLTLISLVCGCHAPGKKVCNDVCVSQQLVERTGYAVCSAHSPCEIFFPPGTSLDDGLTEDEAIVIALCNNAAFQELLVDLKLARGDLIQAGLLPNPEVAFFFPVTDKPYKYLVDFPVESLWLRPIRVAAAEGELQRTRDRLAQAGLDLIRDVRTAYADTLLAQDRVAATARGVTLRTKLAQLAETRLDAGDISPQEAATARIDGLQATQDAVRVGFEVPVAEERLRFLMGIGDWRVPLKLDAPAPVPIAGLQVDALVDEAVATRPDALAATQTVVAARERLRIARLGWIRVLGIADATSGRDTGHELGPALRWTLPIFNRNQGAIIRADGELERAARAQRTVENQIILDVRRSFLQYDQARGEFSWLESKVRPEVEAAIRRSQSAYLEGATAYVVVLETTRQVVDTLLREAQLRADLRRTTAELQRSVGRHLQSPLQPAAVPEPVRLPDPVEPSP